MLLFFYLRGDEQCFCYEKIERKINFFREIAYRYTQIATIWDLFSNYYGSYLRRFPIR